ncbi:MAG: adenosylcobinamide-GDP ribazoletransferase [Elusimicrobia bacterium]|nr:adenosylcobinamide-GDP ribazoletransferase [Elusimicrobiota bacterium]
MIKNFFSAIGLLTIIPVPKKYLQELKHPVIFFPVVGLLIGFILIGVNIVFSKFMPKLITDLFVLITLTVISGGIHIDGFADTIDGLYGGKNKYEIIRIMDDVHIGSIGMVGIVLLVLTKFCFIYSLPQEHVFKSLILMSVVSRFSMVLPIIISKPVKEGLGKMFINSSKLTDCLIASILALLLVFLCFKTTGLLVLIVIVLTTLLITKLFEHKIGGITGDNLGFINEISEVISLFLIIVLI